MTREELENRFKHHPPKNDAAFNQVRSTLLSTCESVLGIIPPHTREASVFITKMEEAMFWANAAIARNQ